MRDICLEIQAILKTVFLDGDVILDQLQLFLQGDLLGTVIQGDPQKTSQGLCHGRNVLCAQNFGPPVDGFQSIIQKMRVHLVFQSLKLCLFDQDLI